MILLDTNVLGRMTDSFNMDHFRTFPITLVDPTSF